MRRSAAGKDEEMSVKLKVCTFNLRTPAKVDEINYFPNRRGRILETIRTENPDLIGFQEAPDVAREWLSEVLTEYVVLGCGREKDLHGEAAVIAFRKSVFDLITLETFWLSLSPSVPGSRYGADQSSCPRVATAAILKHRGAEKPFLFLNTHLDHKGSAARMYGSNQLLQYISSRKEGFILTGDLNALPDAPEIRVFSEYEPRKIVDVTGTLGGTFHNYGRKEVPSKIDYIFTDMETDPKESYVVEDIPVDGLYISDHSPVIGFVTVE